MAVTVQVLIEPKFAESSQTTQYTSDSLITIIDKFTATNTSVGAYSISVNLVQTGTSASDTNAIVKTRVLLPNETYTFPEIVGQVLGKGDFISTLASTSSVINIRASGRLVTN